MSPEERSELEKQSLTLRGELKKWEKGFAAANEGRKAGREEIKQNPSIAQKYKEYNRVRDILNGKQAKSSSVAPSSPKPARETRKRKADDIIQTPSKRHHRTPRKPEPQQDFFDTYDSPSIIRNLFSPTKKQWISPTPQKNGRYYGLFDLMDDDNTTTTPLKDTDGNQRSAMLQATPSRKAGTPNWDEMPFASTRKHSRTPASSSKRKMLDQYTLTTPLKSRNGGGPDTRRTPSSSVSKLHFPTPSFLRRDSKWTLKPVGEGNENSEFLSPPMVRGPRKPLVRGLSSILAGLRKMNEDAEDEDLEILREMEQETAAASKSNKPNKNEASKPKLNAEPEVQVEDSQGQVNYLLGGFDDESKFDSEPETTNRDGNEKLGKYGQPLKTYKKKGQKRTTRRTKIRPTKPSKALPHDVGKRFDSSSPSASPEREVSPDELHTGHHDRDDIPETQTNLYEETNPKIPDIDPDSNIVPFNSKNLDYAIPEEEEEDDIDSGSDYTASSGGTRYRKADQSEHKARVEMKRQALESNSNGKEKGKDGVVGNARKGMRSVKALAGQNFRRLKLRNKGAKGGGGGKGRFGRKR